MSLWNCPIGRSQDLPGAAGSGRLFRPSANYGDRPTTAILILEQGRNPTTDYYLRPRLPPPGEIPTTVMDLSVDPSSVALAAGTFVIIVRYLNGPWTRHLQRHHDRLSGAAYLLDDDLPAARCAADLPLRYRWKIHRLFQTRRRALAAICDRVWVANDHLAKKYAESAATVLPPLPLLEDSVETTPLTYFYYGSAAHAREQAWLAPIVRRVQAETSNLVFVTIGGATVRKLYAGIPRVLVLHPMPWPAYVEALPAIRHGIGLAPLLDSPFNRSRTHTKFFDFTRLGAVGIYSDTTAYARFVRPEVDGLLIPNEPEAWHDAISVLAISAETRAALLLNATAHARRLATSEPLVRRTMHPQTPQSPPPHPYSECPNE